MNPFSFSLANGLPLILTAGGNGPTGKVFVAGRDDVVFSIDGNYSMTIDANNYVTISLTNMHALIFPDKANYSSWFYYATVWANNHGNCCNIHLDVATARQGHGGWSDSNPYWQYAAGWKGGKGGGWVKYRGNIVEPSCSGYSGDGIYHGSARTPGNMTFNLGQVDFTTTTGFWIGANLDCWEGGYEVWQFVEFPIIVFDAPSMELTNRVVNVCEKWMMYDVELVSNSPFAASGGTWELQYSTSSDFSNAVTYTQTTVTNSAIFANVDFATDSTYYLRARLKVSGIRYSRWVETTINTNGFIPPADAMAADLTELDCYNFRHGVSVRGGLV